MRRELTYATVCSGVECMSAAAIGLPLRPVFFSEIEPFPCAVLKHRFPHVPNLGDMSRITAAWVRKWLERIANPATCPDAPRYKACGNGWATNQPRWILLRVLHFTLDRDPR